jgi:BRCA1-associated protein
MSSKHRPRASKAAEPHTKGVYVPSNVNETEVGWGVVHLYRDGQETPGLYDDDDETIEAFREEDCTTLCILAVPAYMAPSDFLAFVGEETKEAVCRFHLLKTSTANRYMVLMKFREALKAREWRKKWNGKRFNSMEVSSLIFVNVQIIKTSAARVL